MQPVVTLIGQDQHFVTPEQRSADTTHDLNCPIRKNDNINSYCTVIVEVDYTM